MTKHVPLSEQTKAKIRERFPNADQAEAERLLLTYGADYAEPAVERIRRDILEICGTSLDEVRRLVALAKGDFRDLILEAEYIHGPDGMPVVKPEFANRPPH